MKEFAAAVVARVVRRSTEHFVIVDVAHARVLAKSVAIYFGHKFVLQIIGARQLEKAASSNTIPPSFDLPWITNN